MPVFPRALDFKFKVDGQQSIVWLLSRYWVEGLAGTMCMQVVRAHSNQLQMFVQFIFKAQAGKRIFVLINLCASYLQFSAVFLDVFASVEGGWTTVV